MIVLSLSPIRILIMILLFSAIAQGQVQKYEPLKIGEKVPDLAFSQLLNYKSKSGRLSDFKSKLVILDFWHAHCVVCIAQFPKLKELQQKFGDALLILPVGFNFKPREIETFVQKRKGTKIEMPLPTAVCTYDSSNILLQLFPCQSMPHEVWIDGEGVLRAITDHELVNERNITHIISSKSASISTRKEIRFLNPCTEVFLITRQGQDSIKFFGSLFAREIDTLPAAGYDLMEVSCDSSVWHFVNVNRPVIRSYKFAYRNLLPQIEFDHHNKRIIIESLMADKFYKISDPEKIGLKEEVFCYELIESKKLTREQVNKKIIDDFDRFFQVDSKIETRKLKCLKLVQLPNHRIPDSKSSSLEIYTSMTGDSVRFTGFPMKDFVFYLNNTITTQLIVNETGFDGPIDINLYNVDENNTEKLRAALNKHGLDLIEGEKLLPVLVLKDLRNKITYRN